MDTDDCEVCPGTDTFFFLYLNPTPLLVIRRSHVCERRIFVFLSSDTFLTWKYVREVGFFWLELHPMCIYVSAYYTSSSYIGLHFNLTLTRLFFLFAIAETQLSNSGSTQDLTMVTDAGEEVSQYFVLC